ncbi:MAG: phosphoribosylglycinamide formyltransferase [Candidatus Dormibacteria bacterium]
MTKRVRIGVLVSGRGSNLGALCEAAKRSDFPGEIALVLSNRRDAGALGVARSWHIPADAMPVSDYDDDTRARDRAMRDRFRGAGVELIVCAGYNRVLSDEFLDAFCDAIINIHPSLLPAFGGGMHAVEDALAYGVHITGCTVQLLEPGIPDGGPIISQSAVRVEADDDRDSLLQKIHEQEWRLLPEAVQLWCQGRIQRDGRVVRVTAPATPAAR